MRSGSEVAFYSHVDASIRLLEELDLLEASNRPVYDSVDLSVVRKLTYKESWRHFESFSFFDARLTDGSLFQFKRSDNRKLLYSFAFIDCPLDAIDYRSFMAGQGLSVDDFGELGREEYDTYLTTCSDKLHVTPIRYDYSPALYCEGCHPAAHVHIGEDNPVRLATARLMNPTSFVLFVLRQMFPKVWVRCADKRDERLLRHVRADLESVPNEYQSAADQHELILT